MVLIDKIGYTRVSTIDQDPENQVRLIAAEGIPSDFIFIDKGVSGSCDVHGGLLKFDAVWGGMGSKLPSDGAEFVEDFTEE
jgi:hypothetical protein